MRSQLIVFLFAVKIDANQEPTEGPHDGLQHERSMFVRCGPIEGEEVVEDGGTNVEEEGVLACSSEGCPTPEFGKVNQEVT